METVMKVKWKEEELGTFARSFWPPKRWWRTPSQT